MADAFHNVRERIRAACAGAGRKPGEVRLLAVSKAQPAARVRDLYERGQRAFGENYLAEAEDKQRELANLDIEWHYIGLVQSSKTRALSERFDWVQSADRIKVLRRLNEQRPAHLPPLNICLQVNIDDEPQKAGCTPASLPEIAAYAVSCERLRLRGVMAIPAPRRETDAQLDAFRGVAELYRELVQVHPEMDTLSIGMSGDLEAAIVAGSTMVRIGTALFGPREQGSG